MDSSGRLLYWVVELSEYDIQYKPGTTIKVQALTDFIVKASYEEEEMKEKETWLLEADDSFEVKGCGAGIVMTSPDGNIYK